LVPHPGIKGGSEEVACEAVFGIRRTGRDEVDAVRPALLENLPLNFFDGRFFIVLNASGNCI